MAASPLPTMQETLDPGYVHVGAPSGSQDGYVPVNPQSGQGTGFFGSALSSGLRSTLAGIGQFGEAGARALGASDFADQAAQYAAQQRALAAAAENPEYANRGPLDPLGIAYKTLQGLPQFAGILGGAALGSALGPEAGAGAAIARILGGTAAAYPTSVGDAIQRARDEGQPVDQLTAAKALALGVPEAALNAALPEIGEGWLAGRIPARGGPLFGSDLAGKVVRGAAVGAAVQAPVAATGELLMQQMGDPNRSFAERSQQIVNAALGGVGQGGLMGGILHSLAKKPATDVSTDDLVRSTNLLMPPGTPGTEASLPQGPTEPSTVVNPQLPAPGTPGTEARLQAPQFFPQEPEPLPGVQPASGEAVTPPVQPGQVDQGVRALPAPALEPVTRPVSGEAIPLPGEKGTPPEVQNMSGADLLSALSRHTDLTSEGAKDITAEITNRLKGVDVTDAGSIKNTLLAQDAEKAKPAIAAQQVADIKSVTRGFVPDYLKPHLGDDMALKGAIFDEAMARDQAGTPLGDRLTKIAKKFDVLGDDGKLVDPRAQQEAADSAKAQADLEQSQTTNLGTDPDTPSRVMREGIPDQHQGKWDALEALRKDAPQDFVSKIDDLQSKLAAPKRGEISSIVKQTSDLRKAIEGQKAADAVRAPEEQAPKAEPIVTDETQGAEKFAPPTSEAKPAEEPAPAPKLSKQEQLKAKQSGGKNAVQERSPAPVDAREQPQDGGAVRSGDTQGSEAPREVQASGRAQDTGAQGQIEPKAAKAVTGALSDLRGNIGALMKQELPQRSRMFKGERVGESPKAYAKRTADYQAALDAVDRQQAQISKALKSGDPAELAKIKDDHFDTRAYDDFYDQLSPKGQKLMDEHGKAVDALLSAVKEASGKTYTLTGDQAFSSRVPTPHDQVLSDMIDKGASARDLLTHIARNGSNSIRRTMAARQLQISKADPKVRFGSMQEMADEHPTNVYGDYHSGLDRIRIFDKADLEHTLLHEFEHAATAPALERNPAIKAEADRLWKAAKAQMTPDEATHPSMANPAEMIAEARANPDFANLLDTMQGPKGSIWQSIKDMVRRLFGYPQGAESMLDHVESLAGRAAKVTNEMGTVQGMDRVTGLYARSVQDLADRVTKEIESRANGLGVGLGLHRISLMWRTFGSIATSFDRVIPAIRDIKTFKEARSIIQSKLVGPMNTFNNMRRGLDAKGGKLLDELMSFSALKIDPRKAEADHAWLRSAMTPELRAQIKRANQLWNDANRGDAAVAKAYTAGFYANHANLHAYVVANAHDELKRGGHALPVDDPAAEYVKQSSLHSNPYAAMKYWSGMSDTYVSRLRKIISETQTEMDKPETKAEERAKMQSTIKSLKSMERSMTRVLSGAQQEPNFALGRKGGYAVSATMADGFGAKQVQAVRAALDEAGFGDAVVQEGNTNGKVFIRFDKASHADEVHKIFETLKKQDVFEGDVLKGLVANSKSNHGILPLWVENKLAAVRAAYKVPEDTDAETRVAIEAAMANAVDQITQEHMDMLPESALAKTFAKREDVQGFSGKMALSSINRGMNTARGLSNMFMSKDIADAHTRMSDQVTDMKNDSNVSFASAVRAQQASSEILLREAQRQWVVPHGIFDTIRHGTHVMEMGFSIPYVATLASQIPTLALPELGKHFGFVKSAQALAKASPMALKILKAGFTGNDKWGFILTPDKLSKAGIPKPVADFILHQDNIGAFAASAYTQHIFDNLHHGDGILSRALEMTGGFTLNAEMLPRLVTALAAKDLFEANPKSVPGRELHEFVKQKVDKSQFDWGTDNSARATGKHGIVGAASPLVTQFQGFHLRLMEMLYHQTADAFGARGPEEAKLARKFLLGHLAATAMLSGTMGLPMVGFFAGLYDKLADAFGDDTHDIKASYRNFLSDTFGNGVGEVLAHGVPRMAGIDFSHLGEDKVIPFTNIMATHARWEDAYGDLTKDIAGSAAGIGNRWLMAARDFSNGDLVEGVSKVAPEMARNAIEAGIISKYGYTDKAGFQYPGGRPSSTDVVMKALGFKPSDEANYDEKRDIVQGLTQRNEYDTQNIQTHLARGFNRQDPAAYAAWMQASSAYALSHPGKAPPMASFANYMQEHMRSAAIAGGYNVPLGTAPNDINAMRAVRFGNIGDR